MIRPTLSLCLLLIGAQPVLAASFTPPQNCTLEMTVQNRSCTVSQYFRCMDDPQGDQRVTIFDEEGPAFESHIDRETRWIESTNLRSGLSDRLEDEARDHASLSTLLRTGRDDFDFWTLSNSGQRLRHIGHDTLTGEARDIGGVQLEVTEFSLKTYSEDGQELIHRQGRQFISTAHGRFYGGVESSADWTGTRIESDDSPVSFAFPGQPGFGLTVPQYGCDLQMVRLAVPPVAPNGQAG